MALESQPLREGARKMTFDPDELVTLTDHGSMKLCSAVARAMVLPPEERDRATIVREGEPAILEFEQIKDLVAQWLAAAAC